MIKNYLIFITTIIVFTIIPMKIYSDISIPTTTAFYFIKDNKPYDKPVKFKVKCYGYSWNPSQANYDYIWYPSQYSLYPSLINSERPKKSEMVFTFSATCSNYGCLIPQNYYLNYRHINYCDLEGEFDDGKQFIIKKYSSSPINFYKCKNSSEINEDRQCEIYFDLTNLKMINEKTSEKTSNNYIHSQLLESKFIFSLIITLLIEVSLLILIIRKFFKLKDIFISKIIIIGSLASIITLPYLWFVFPPYFNSLYYIYFGEFFIIIFEGIFLKYFLEIEIKKTLLLSLIINTCSYLFGIYIITKI